MQIFEYKTIIIPDDEDPVPILNTEGQNGWEVIFIEYDYAHRIWMKRKLEKKSSTAIPTCEKGLLSRSTIPKRNP